VAEGKAGFHNHQDSSILDKASLNDGKLDKSSPLAQPPKQPNTTRNLDARHGRSRSQILKCPECGSNRLYKDGLRYLTDSTTIQRWLCRECCYRFSEKKPLQKNRDWQINTSSALLSKRQVCELLTRASKNLTEVETRQETAQREGTTQTADIKGRIVDFLWYLKKQGRAEITIEGYRQRLFQILKAGIDLLNPEAVKDFLSKRTYSNRTKAIDVCVYASFLKFLKIPWDPPTYRPERTIPFIPTEQEIDQLIAATGKKPAIFLQLLKETGMRCGEASKLKWIDVDFIRKTVRITPEKGSDPRILHISDKLAEMLGTIPKKSERIFSMTKSAMSSNFYLQRKKIARKLANPRILSISFHTFRHWKGTMEYHRTKDPYHVKQILGHRRMDSTMLYINIEQAIFCNESSDEFYVKVAETVKEIRELLETGFEYVLQKDNLAYFRKRK
jgi:integrase/recombinase XerD